MPDDDLVLVRRDDLRAALIRRDLPDERARLRNAVKGKAATACPTCIGRACSPRFCSACGGSGVALSGSHESPKEQT